MVLCEDLDCWHLLFGQQHETVSEPSSPSQEPDSRRPQHDSNGERQFDFSIMTYLKGISKSRATNQSQF